MRSLAFFLPILHLGLAWAQMGEGQGTYLPRPKWDEALNNPNATGRFEFDGYNITAAISTSDSRDINNLPSDGFIAGANLRPHSPPSIVATDDEGGNRTIAAHESWHLCFTVMNYNWSKFSKNLTDRGRTTGFSFRLPEFGMGSPNVMQWGSPWTFNNKENTSQYDIMGQTYPVIINWGFNDTVRGERNLASIPRNTVTCVRATRPVGEQSVLPNEGDEMGVGRGPGVSMWGLMACGGWCRIGIVGVIKGSTQLLLA